MESMNVKIGAGSRACGCEFDLSVVLDVINCKPTTTSREMSEAREKEILFGTNLERSYPPKVKLPKTPFDPVVEQQHVSDLTW